MPEELDELRTDTAPEDSEEEGGPVKSFLDHLEDLRWVLIKSLVALGVAFIVCLVACDQVVNILKWPLNRARVSYPRNTQVVTFQFGDNRLGVFQMPVNDPKIPHFGTNQFVTFHVEPMPMPQGWNAVSSTSANTIAEAGANPGTTSTNTSASTSTGTNTNLFVLGMRMDHDSTEATRFTISLISQAPATAFFVAVQVAVYAGGLLAAPFILYFVAAFVFPALKMKEKKYVYRGLGFGLGLFTTGVAFCYFVLLPIALSASVKYTQWMGFQVPFWHAEGYISFVTKFMLGMGLGFEMPVILLVLVKIGVLNYKILAKSRRYVIIINFFLGAILTTPEIITQILMALPLQILFEITIWIAWYWERKEKKRLAAEEAASGGND